MAGSRNTAFLHVLLVFAATWRLSIGSKPKDGPDVKGVKRKNLLVNPSFEDPLDQAWKDNGFTFERTTTDVKDGKYAANCSGRSSEHKGPIYTAPLAFHQGRHYEFDGYVKVLGDPPGHLWQHVKVTIAMTFSDGGSIAYVIAYRGFVNAAKGWIRLNGSLEAPQKEPIQPILSINGPLAGVDFLVDGLGLYEVPENTNWREESDRIIEKNRKSNLNVNLSLPAYVDAHPFDVEISLKKHAFLFGAKIEEFELGLDPPTMYERIYNSWFNAAAIQSYKWMFNRGDRYNPDFSRATNANDFLLRNGKTVRGHSILWDISNHVPNWVRVLPTDELLPVIKAHVKYMMNLTHDKIAHFDVQNEHIHGHYYEEKLQNPNVSKMAFTWAKAENAKGPKLYLNDFQCVTSGANTEDMYDLGMQYLSEGIPIEGLGIQGHTKDFVKPDPTAMWKRLDRLASTGLDLMISEFDIGCPDQVDRADWLEDSIRTFFGHPSLKGVILGGFWNGSMRDPDHELVTGPTSNDITVVESGERWACLVRREWTTEEKFNLGVAGTSLSVRGFHGDYDLVVRRDGVPVQRETLTLGAKDVTVSVQITASTAPIALPTPREDLTPACISHRDEKTFSTRTLASPAVRGNTGKLTCRTVRSSPTFLEWFTESDVPSVSCGPNEVMTSCYTYLKLPRWTRKGETIHVRPDFNGTVCTATGALPQDPIIKRFQKTGVRTYARCCKVSGMTCDYRSAGPSLAFPGAKAEARCPAGKQALGCSSFQQFVDPNGVKPSGFLAGCVAERGTPAPGTPLTERSGVNVFAVCCSAPGGLDCQHVRSRKSSELIAGKIIKVYCPDGYVMTGCNVVAADGNAAGAKILRRSSRDHTKWCGAYPGKDAPPGSAGITAHAVCCKVPRW